MTSLKLIIADTNTKTAEQPIWFGHVWSHIHQTLNEMGAFSNGKDAQKAPLTESLSGAAFSQNEFHGIYNFSIMWVNNVGFEVREDRQLNIMQSINSCGYDFLEPNESYVYLGMDFGGVANDALLSIADRLMQNGYKAYFFVQDDLDSGYTELTSTLISNSLEKAKNIKDHVTA